MKTLTLVAAAALIAVCVAPRPASTSSDRHPPTHRPASVRAYTRHLVGRAWPTTPEWHATDTLIGADESGWDPCAHYPNVHHDCGYDGTNACGIPQRDPCPAWWRGRLYTTRYAQARWFVQYVKARYGDPIAALAHRNAFGWY